MQASCASSEVPVIGIWDDHDFGINNGGMEYSDKDGSQALLMDFLGEPADSPRRSREGVYASYTFGSSYPVVQIVLLVRARECRGWRSRGHHTSWWQ